MRNAWIAIALIVLLVGAAVAYGIGRAGKPARAAAPPAQPVTHREIPAPPDAATVAVRPRREDDAPLPKRTTAESRAETLAAATPKESDTPARSDSGPSSRVPGTGTNPTQAPSPPTSSRAAQRTSPALSPAMSQQGAPPAAPAAPAAASPAPPDDPDSDRRPPDLQGIRFDPPEIKDGGTVMLSISSTDDLSGVKSVFGAVRSPSGAATIPFGARDVSGGGVFSATIVIPAHGETGDWFVGNLQIVDKAENTLVSSFVRASVPEGGVLRVVSDDSDSTPPEVHHVSVVKASVEAGEQNQVVIEVDDDRSGVAQVTGAFQSPSKAAYIPFNCAHNGESPTWEGVVSVPQNADCGEWTLKQIRVVDKANNSAFLTMDSAQVGRVSFVVSNGGASGGGCDSEPPVVDALFFSPASVPNVPMEITLTLRAHDDGSGVASMSGWIDGPIATNGQAPRINFELTPNPADKDGPMSVRITVPEHAARGVWRVSLAQVMDKARNTRAYNRDDPALRDAFFTVE